MRSRVIEFRRLGLGSVEDGNVWVGIFPEREEISVRGASFDGVTLQYAGATETEMCRRTDGVVTHDAAIVEDFLELNLSFAALSRDSDFVRGRGLQPSMAFEESSTPSASNARMLASNRTGPLCLLEIRILRDGGVTTFRPGQEKPVGFTEKNFCGFRLSFSLQVELQMRSNHSFLLEYRYRNCAICEIT
jgi:hypothetical protein